MLSSVNSGEASVRMVRNKNQTNGIGKSPKKTLRKEETGSSSSASSQENEPKRSVHHQNFVIISFPVIVLFNLFRAILYQLYLILRAVYNASSRVFYRPRLLRKKECLEICVVDKVKENSGVEALDNQELPLLLDCHGVETTVEMNGKMGSAGDPLLSKQKQFHRKAFEYISTALRLDEENKGESTNKIIFLKPKGQS